MLAIVTLITTIIGVGVSRALAVTVEGDNVIITQDGTEIGRVSLTEEVPLFTAEQLVGRVSTTAQSQPDNPQVSISNPLDIETLLFNMSLVPASTAKEKLAVRVEINDRLLMQSKAGEFTDVTSINIPIPARGLTFERGKKINIFAWNFVDGVSVAVTVSALVGK